MINCNLKVSDQCIAASKKANMMLGLISRNLDHKAQEVMTKLYTAFVRPHLECAIQFWSPNYIKHQYLLTKLIPTLCNLSYEERLKQLDMFTLHKRRIDQFPQTKNCTYYQSFSGKYILFQYTNVFFSVNTRHILNKFSFFKAKIWRHFGTRCDWSWREYRPPLATVQLKNIRVMFTCAFLSL